ISRLPRAPAQKTLPRLLLRIEHIAAPLGCHDLGSGHVETIAGVHDIQDVLCDLRGHVYLTSSTDVGKYGQSSSRSIYVFAASACSTVRNMPNRSLPPLIAKKRYVVPAS